MEEELCGPAWLGHLLSGRAGPSDRVLAGEFSSRLRNLDCAHLVIDQQHVSTVSRNTYAKASKAGKGLNAALQTRTEERARFAAQSKVKADEKDANCGRDQSVETSLSDRKTFTWEKLKYRVPVSGGTQQLLNDVYGFVKPGSLTALMGASGAGKTTCLDVLAQRKTIGVVTGDILVDGRPLSSDFQRGTAYGE